MLLFKFAIQTLNTHPTNEPSVMFKLSDFLIEILVPLMANIFPSGNKSENQSPSLTICCDVNRHYLWLGWSEVQTCRISVHGIWRAAKEQSLSWFLLERTVTYQGGFFLMDLRKVICTHISSSLKPPKAHSTVSARARANSCSRDNQQEIRILSAFSK